MYIIGINLEIELSNINLTTAFDISQSGDD